MIRQYELVERVKSYDPSADEDALNRAYVFAMKAHGAQKRALGDPYFLHPLEVAGIMTGYKLDTATIITALLHDTIEDTETTREDIEKHFGDEVARLVDGVTKLTRIELQSNESKQAENFRKLLLAMSEDIRVLLVKLADRLHNMRTIFFIKNPEKRVRIAAETMEIYAPLAERIGMHQIKDELQDLSFAELNPEGRDSIVTRLEFLREQGGDLVGKLIEEIGNLLTENGIKGSITGREKTPYSIWRKMQRQEVGFEQLSDIMAFRVMVEDVEACYKTLGVVHGCYPTVPGRFKDYISTPKPNGYQSLHTTVIGPESHRVEIQIRTKEMHDVAENGVAAHWHYKGHGSQKPIHEGKQYRWLRELLDILENADEPDEFLEHTKLEMFQDQVFCFSPKGDLISLPRGATPVDFAYAVHTEVGNRCVGAKINRRIVPLRTELQNGDQVEIITSKAQKPSPTWERFVITGKARACIRRFVRQQQHAEYVALGRVILQRAFKQAEYEFSDKALQGVLKKFGQDNPEDICAAVGNGHLSPRDVLEAVFPGMKNPCKAAAITNLHKSRPANKKHAPSSVPIKGLIPGMAMHMAGCCHPLPGDRIVGIVTSGTGVTIHTIDCDTLQSFHDQPERWLDVAWDREHKEVLAHTGRLNVVLMNEPGGLGSLSTVIAKNGGNISNLKITHRTAEFFDMLIDVEVQDVRHLTNIIAALRATPEINSVDRAKN